MHRLCLEVGNNARTGPNKDIWKPVRRYKAELDACDYE